MKTCRQCQNPLTEGELFCAKCGTEQEDDLFATGSFETAPPEPQIAAPPPRPVIQKPAEPTLELDVQETCSVCGNTLRSPEEKTNGKCTLHMAPRRASVRTQTPKEVKKKRNFTPVLLALVAVALIALALLLRPKRKEPVPTPVATTTAQGEGQAPAPTDAASLGRQLAADPEDSAEVAAYIAESGSHPRSDGNAEYAAMEALLDDTTERSPEETAKARAALMGISPNTMEQMKKLESLASKHPNNPVVNDALAESKVRLDPRAAMSKELAGAGSALGRVKGLVLAARGEVEAATAVLREEAKKDPVAAHDLRVLLAQTGRCAEAEALLKDDGTLGAVLELAEHRVACKRDSDGARSVLDAARDQPGLKPTKRASLDAAAALASLGDDKERDARCKAVTDPTVSALTNEAFLRCALVRGENTCKVASTSKNEWVPAAQALACKKPPKVKPARNWDPAVAMIAATSKLTQKKPPLAALDEAASALLHGTWDGRPGYPITRAELLALAKLAPAKAQPVANSIATALSGDLAQAAPPLRPTVNALAAYREGKPPPAAPQTTKLAKLIKAAAKKDKKGLGKLLRDQSVGPYAFAALDRMGAATKQQREAALKAFAGHPALHTNAGR